MKGVTNVVLSAVMGCFYGCCSIEKSVFDDVELKPADLSDYDEGLLAYDCCFNKSVPESVYPSLCGVTVLYPNLVALKIYSDDGMNREIDFDWFRGIHKLSQVDVSGRWGVRNFKKFCKNPSKNNITVRLSYGSWSCWDGDICQMPRMEGAEEGLAGDGVESDVKIGDYIGGDCEKCSLDFHVWHNLYKEGDSFCFADFSNDGEGVATIRNFPECCNATGIDGNFELAESCNGELIESMTVSGRGEKVSELLNEITPSRFPRLRYLRVYADSDDEIEMDVTKLLNFKNLKMLTFKSKNVIPSGLSKLYCLGEKTCFEFRVAIRR